MTDPLSSNPYKPIFAAQKALFRTGATRAREWRLDQLARMERMVSENEAELQEAVKSDFKTASQEYVFETQSAIGEVAFHLLFLEMLIFLFAAPVKPNCGGYQAPLHSRTIAQTGFVALNAPALVFDLRSSLAMSVSELKQIISAFVIVCGVLAAVIMAM